MKQKMCAAIAVLAFSLPFNLSAIDLNGAVDAAAKGVSPAKEHSSALIEGLTKSLGVTPQQAAGGTAALLNKAKSNLGEEDFSKLISGVPDLSSLLDGSGGLGSLLGNDGALSLAKQFSSLGMQSDMIGKFTSQLLKYVESAGGPEMMKLLKGALL
jgi:hypothetical protein